jgi:vinculin
LTKFLELSHYHNELSHSYRNAPAKKSFIQTAQAIMIDTNKFIKAIQPIIDECTDKRLKAQIQSTLNRILTLAQQLKIIAAVKASAPNDSDKGVQLITSSQNLVASIKKALRDCVSCSIRARKGSNVAESGITFRKIVYARQLVAAGLVTKKMF